MKIKLIVFVKDGIVQSVISNVDSSKLELLILDGDIETNPKNVKDYIDNENDIFTANGTSEQIINNKDVIDINFNIYSRHYKLMKE
jgi:hypothetical protein